MRYPILLPAGRLAMTLLFAGSAAGNAQEFKSPLWGSSGGTTSYNLDCGSGGVMVGVYGKTGQWIDAIGVTCQRVNPDGTLGSSFTRGPSGGSGGTGSEARCAAGKVIAAMTAYTGSYVNAFVISCFSWSASTRRPVYEPQPAFKWFGLGSAGTQNARFVCSVEKVGKALRGKYGWYIDSLQFVCDDFDK
jgi:hypothetical protein